MARFDLTLLALGGSELVPDEEEGSEEREDGSEDVHDEGPGERCVGDLAGPRLFVRVVWCGGSE